MKLKPVWIVQSLEDGFFLMPLNGDVGYTQWLSEAGLFEDKQAAIDTAVDLLDGQFSIYAHYVMAD
ncbi:hypothetical protein [Janthinobacterium sp. B9-8]|jgi:hypothetical protein|uniref:hypothetical protein n=1 Tax=Janthinobacterium sp. B9-8 TaxID=1236179 RepID=UPI00061D1AA5|nr:hypothetical protein [Janthinobacterium sp. B9-8]AMC34212.1 hypothetical protein VN23_06195 [Janthinobacterium sp. B9-8]